MIIFNELSLKEKNDLLNERGIHLASLERRDLILELFYLDGFFIDVFFEKSTLVPLHMRTFSSAKRLYKYQLSQQDLIRKFFRHHLK